MFPEPLAAAAGRFALHTKIHSLRTDLLFQREREREICTEEQARSTNITFVGIAMQKLYGSDFHLTYLIFMGKYHFL
jgi:hypothetical protein